MTFYILPILAIILAFAFIAALLVVFFGLNMIFINLKTSVPWAKTPSNSLEKIFTEINLLPGSLIYDLGCGDGRFLFLAEKKGFKAVGYELSLYPYLKSLLVKFIKRSKVEIKSKDFLKEDLSAADAIFIFLTAAVMEKVGIKLKQSLKPGAMIISYGATIPGWQIEKTLNTEPSKTYVYFN